MQPDQRDAATLWDILHACKRVAVYINDKGPDSFRQNSMCHFAVIAQIQIIGEATKRLSDEFRSAHGSIPWREMAGMRDILIHMYDRVNLEEVWQAATCDIPELLQHIEPLLPPPPQ